MNKKNFFKLIGFIAITGLIAFSCSKGSSYTAPKPQPGGTSPGLITMYNMTFAPSSVTVTKGTVVKWQNNDGYAHTVNSNDGTTFSSGNINGGESFSYTTTVAGTFNYHCLIHGLPMSGVLIVTP
jgi:plastocyanin